MSLGTLGTLGPLADEILERVNFTFATPSPLTLYNLEAGDELLETTLVIGTAFDDAAATVAVGTVAAPSLVFAPADTNLGKADCQWVSSRKYEIALAEIFRLLLTPGGSTQGAGYVLFRIRRA